MRNRDRRLVFYTRPECHLCAVAAPRIRRAALWTGFALQEVNIDHHPEMAVDYGFRIPVVEGLEGQTLAEGEIKTFPLLIAILSRKWKFIRQR